MATARQTVPSPIARRRLRCSQPVAFCARRGHPVLGHGHANDRPWRGRPAHTDRRIRVFCSGNLTRMCCSLLFTACFNAIEAGYLEQARPLAQAMLDHATSSRLPLTAGHSHYFLGVVHYYWNELDAAKHHFGELIAKRLSVHTQAARNGMIGMTRVHVANVEISAAWSVMELLSQFDLDRLGQDGDDARSLRAQLAHLQGDTETAYRWADAYADPVVGRSLLWLQDPHLAKARILLARGTDADVQAALDILDALIEIAQRTFSVRSQIEALVPRALALEMQGKADAAVAVLRQAVELARPGSFIRVFVDLGPPVQTMLLRALPDKASPPRPYVASWPLSLSFRRRSRSMMPEPGITLRTPG